jgi:glycerophosphoryl diester phosphodiesterase
VPVWPYPFWIAHRGAGKLAPENTLAAFRLGAQHGYQMFECDAKISADGVVFLMHDNTLDRTTMTSGIAGDCPWSALSQLDAGGWHSPQYAGEPPCSLAALAKLCLANGFALNIEIKPSLGAERKTGEVVAHEAAALWSHEPSPPLLSSFKPEALFGAKDSAPSLPRALLLDSWWDGWLKVALDLSCVAVIVDYPMWDVDSVAVVHRAGMRALSYTVNDSGAVHHLQVLGTDGIITDRVDLFGPLNP